MRAPAAWVGVLAVLLALGALGPCGAEAQPGFYATPRLSVAEVYDDNLFSASTRRERDFISRFSPVLEAGYRSVPLTLLTRYAFDAEFYANHPELDEPLARQEASVELQGRPNPTLRLALSGTFAEAQSASELNVETGLATDRVRAQRLSMTASARWQYDPRTEATVDGEAIDDEVEGEVSTRTYAAGVRLQRQLTARGAGRLGYTVRHFLFDGGEETITSQAATVGWRYAVTQRTNLELDVGPRVSDGSLDAEVSAALRHRLQSGELALTYAHSETTIIGEVGTVTFDSVTAGAWWEPRRFLRLRAAPSVVRAEQAGNEAMVYLLGATASYQLTKFVAIEAAYAFSFQRGSTEPTTEPNQEITRNIVALRLTFTPTYRVR
jgi:hypothetical protein